MKRLNYLCLVGLLFVFAASATRGESLEWVRQLGTSTLDYSHSVSSDRLGNVYISGFTRGSLGGPNAGGFDAFVSKFDAAGIFQWTRQLGTTAQEESFGVSADGMGNVYISGYTTGSLGARNAGPIGADAFVSKYDATGTLQWTRQLGTNVQDQSSGVSADGLGNVYISGLTFGSLDGPNAGPADAFVSKYDAVGTLLWSRQLGSVWGDGSRDVSADDLGNVYITGSTEGSLGGPSAGLTDAFVSKYDAAGTLQWSRQLGTSSDDFSSGVSADGLGNVYISGDTLGSLDGPYAGNGDAFVSKYDAAGALLWTRQLGTSMQDFSFAVSADRLGSVYISGRTSGSLGGPTAGGIDAFVSKYDAAGNFLWTHQLGTSSEDESHGVSADGLGNVYFSGYTRGNLGGPNAGDRDAFVAKIADHVVPEPSSLRLVLAATSFLGLVRLTRRRRMCGTLSRSKNPPRVAGRHFVGPTLLAIFAGAFAASAARGENIEWIRQLGTSAYDRSRGVSADGLGNVYISGDTTGSLGGPRAGDYDPFVSKYDAAGNLEWTRQFGTSFHENSYGVSADGLGNVYVSGSTPGSLGGPNSGNGDAFVRKYDAAGNFLWTRQLGTSSVDDGRGVSADGLGNVYISGSTAGSLGGPNAGSTDAFVAKYDAAGTLQWSQQLGTSAIDISYGVSADGLGSVYISGSTFGNLGGPNAGTRDAFVSKYDTAGTLEWTRQLGTIAPDQSQGVSADGLGNVYISGYTRLSLGGPSAGDDDAFVSKYDAAGNFQWTRQLGSSQLDLSLGVSADGLGGVYISGYTGGSLGGPIVAAYDAFVSKYDAAGNFQWTRQLDSADGSDSSWGVSADGLGNVYISGETRGSLGGPNAGDGDAFVAKLADANVPEPSSLLVALAGVISLLGCGATTAPPAVPFPVDSPCCDFTFMQGVKP